MFRASSYSSWKRSRLIGRVFQYTVLFVVMLFVLVPVVMLVFVALKTRGELLSSPYRPPVPIRWDNMVGILQTPIFWQMMRNSLFVMIVVTLAVVTLTSLAAFVFARMQFRSKGFFFNLFTLGLMFPITVAILPVYFVLRQMDLLDNLWGIIIVQVAFGLSGNIMILRGFFTAIPAELQDAAYIDGCTSFGFFWRILLPLARPALSAVAALTMILSWNDFLIPLIVLNSESFWTLPLGTMQFQGQYGSDLALVSAFIVLSAIPTLIFYIFAERQIVAGLTAGAVKG
jgi:raffinose/stachyose/melibiose transport system permease protein